MKNKRIIGKAIFIDYINALKAVNKSGHLNHFPYCNVAFDCKNH